jgi:uncharacterized protein
MQRVEALRARLLTGVPDVRADRTDEQHARWLLAYLVDWHRREDKATWWEYFRLRDLSEEDLFDEPQGIASLIYVERVDVVRRAKTGKPTGSVIDRYGYPVQEMEIRPKDELKLKDGKAFGVVLAADRVARTIDVRKGPAQAELHPSAVFAHSYVNVEVLEDAIYSFGERVATAGAIKPGAAGPDPAARGLLLRESPRLWAGAFAKERDETVTEFAVRIVGDLDRTVLPIQGPPGAGKTYTGAQMISRLVAAGKQVGVIGPSHRVIRNLLDAVAEAAAKSHGTVRLGQRKVEPDEPGVRWPLSVLTTNEAALQALQSREIDVLGATAWLWARPEFANAVAVLFVDEAGQMSLANTIAVAGGAGNLVLLGDPQQLEQPQKGRHPDGVDASALQHVLGPHETIPDSQGIFLPVTWRLAPSICAFTSELFYEGRLTSKPALDQQQLAGVGEWDGSGLSFIPVDHDGNRNSSPEEIEAVANLVGALTAPGANWVDEGGVARPLTAAEVLVVSPYNAQVSRLAERLEPVGVRVGTVDKFQGQEAPVVIYSMATSRPDDAPRGMGFLYNLHRLNVATSRARCRAIIVASPRLFEPECRTPRQMKLANALCRYRERAQLVRV